MLKFRITQNGKELDPSKYIWDEKTRIFSTNESNLVIDFSDLSFYTFNTGHDCIFKTGSSCTFKTGSGCTFNTGHNCIFKTGTGCIFDTGSGCIFDTGSDCVFKVGYNCSFKTGSNCVIVRRDIFEIIQLERNKTLKLNDYNIKGYKYIENKRIIIIDGKRIEISNESYDELKKQLI